MVLRQCLFCVLAAGAGLVNEVQAQPVRACPDGQAVNSLNANGTPLQCIAVPAPANLAPLEMAIVQESAERKQADADLRASINEARIVGRYAFSGTQMCLSSTFGFDESLRPRASTDPSLSAVVFPNAAYSSGFRNFNEDGTGEVEITSIQGVGLPSIFVTASGFAGVGTAGSGPGARPSGSFNRSSLTGTFTWEVTEGKLVIRDADAVGVFAAGPSAGCALRTEDVPPMVGVLAKDRRTISLLNDGVAVENFTITCPGGAPSSVPRICHRERLLQKM